MKVLPHIMRNVNEFNIPAGNSCYEILYFGVNLILMFDYRLSFDVEVQNSNDDIQVLIISRKDVPPWKTTNESSNVNIYYKKLATRINDVFKPSISDAYAFVLNNMSSKPQKVEVAIVHTWLQEVKESQLQYRNDNNLS